MTPSGKSRRFPAPSLPIPDFDHGHRRLFVDMTPDSGVEPSRGDVLVSVGKRGVGTRYLVLTSYRVKRKDPSAPPRFQLGVKVVLPNTLASIVNNVGAPIRRIEFHWYSRRKRTFEDLMRHKEAR